MTRRNHSSFYKRNKDFPPIPLDPKEVLYLGTLVNPVDHRPYAIIWKHYAYVVTPAARPPLRVWGQGYFGEDDTPSRETDCPRSHTPGGVAKKGRGLGLMLYSGLALAAGYASAIPKREANDLDLPEGFSACISSSESGEPGRSSDASSWWHSQVEKGFAVEHDVEGHGECDDQEESVELDIESTGFDEDWAFSQIGKDSDDGTIHNLREELSGSVRFEFCPNTVDAQVIMTTKVFRSGLVLDWNDKLDDIADEVERTKAGFPVNGFDPAIWLELDLSELTDDETVDFFITHIRDNVTDDDLISEFLKKNNLPDQLRLPGMGLGSTDYSMMGLYRRNRRKRSKPFKHSKAWKARFGEFIDLPV